MRELQRKLDHDIKLKDFFAIKGNVRVNAELEAREADRKQLQQELTDKQLADLQNIMKEIQVQHFLLFLFFISHLFVCFFLWSKTDKIHRTETMQTELMVKFASI